MVEVNDVVGISRTKTKYLVDESATPEVGDTVLIVPLESENLLLSGTTLEVGDTCAIFKGENEYFARGKVGIITTCDEWSCSDCIACSECAPSDDCYQNPPNELKHIQLKADCWRYGTKTCCKDLGEISNKTVTCKIKYDNGCNGQLHYYGYIKDDTGTIASKDICPDHIGSCKADWHDWSITFGNTTGKVYFCVHISAWQYYSCQGSAQEYIWISELKIA